MRKTLFVGKPLPAAIEEGRAFLKEVGALYAPMVATWGVVKKRNSLLNLVDVEMAGGVIRKGISVSTREWSGKSYGGRNLPPLGALVLILFTNQSLSEGIVIGSKITPLATGIDQGTLAASNKEDEELTITNDGWSLTHDRATGDYQAKVGSGPDIQIDVKKSNKTVKVLANGTSIEVTSAGAVTITAKSGQAVNVNAGSNADLNLSVAGTGKVVIAGGTIACNDFAACLFSGAPHGTGTVAKVLVP